MQPQEKNLAPGIEVISRAFLYSDFFQTMGLKRKEGGHIYPFQIKKTFTEVFMQTGVMTRGKKSQFSFHPNNEHAPALLQARLQAAGVDTESWMDQILPAAFFNTGFRVFVFFPRELPALRESIDVRTAGRESVTFAPYRISTPFPRIGAVLAQSPHALAVLAKQLTWLKPIANALKDLHPEGLYAFFPEDDSSFPGYDAEHGKLPALAEHYGLWTVLGEGEDWQVGKPRQRRAICSCTGCRQEHLVVVDSLLSGESMGCEDCCHAGKSEQQGGAK